MYRLIRDLNSVLIKGTLFDFISKDKIKVGEKLYKVNLTENDYELSLDKDNTNKVNTNKIKLIDDEIDFVKSVLKSMAPPISTNCPAYIWGIELEKLLKQKKSLEIF